MIRRLPAPASLLLLVLTTALIAAQDPQDRGTTKPDEPSTTTPADESTPSDADKAKAKETKPVDPNARVVKSLDEWRRQLTGPQFMVTRMKATEPPFSGRYASGHFRGTFVCVCCGTELFSSAHKFESGTGWPSFWRPVSNKALTSAPDYSDGTPRIEVNCARCDAHLGHVFPDGPPPTGQRFCINSLSLKLVPPGASSSASKKSTSKPKSSAKTPTRDVPQPTTPEPEAP